MYCVLYAIMVAFSPLAQWWWSVNSIAEILAAGQGVVVCWKLYLDNEDLKKRFLFAAGFLYCAGVFIFGIYPAWQVTFGYVFLFCLIAVSFQKSNALKSLWRDKFFWILGTAVMLAPIVHAVYVSRDMIEIQMATEYPGKRFNTGGEWNLAFTLLYLFSYGIDPLLPFSSMSNLPHNQTGISSFFSMAPLGLLMYFYLRFKFEVKDFFLTLMFALSIFFIAWDCVVFPESLAKASFIGMTVNLRTSAAIHFTYFIMMFRGLFFLKDFPKTFCRLLLAIIIAILPVVALHNLLPDWFEIKKAFSVFAFTSVSVFLFLTPMNKKTFVTLAVLMLGIGATINPINKGVDVIYKMPVGQKISEIVQQDKSLWIVEDESVFYNDVPIMYGAPTINSVNICPVLDRWKKIDLDLKNFKIYNRYAHIAINFQNNESTNFKYVQDDVFKLNLNPEDLPKLEAKYIFSRNGELENFSVPQVQIKKIYEDAGSFIYKVN